MARRVSGIFGSRTYVDDRDDRLRSEDSDGHDAKSIR